jgi:hypothetical protein
MTAPAVSGPETSVLLDGHNRTSKSRPPFRYCCAIHRVGGWVCCCWYVRERSLAAGNVTRNLARQQRAPSDRTSRFSSYFRHYAPSLQPFLMSRKGWHASSSHSGTVVLIRYMDGRTRPHCVFAVTVITELIS